MDNDDKMTSSRRDHRNFLVTFMLACSFGPFGLRHFYVGNKLLGWIRVGLSVGGFVWLIVFLLIHQPALAFLGFATTIAAIIWAIGDFFYVYFRVKTDADGQPLTITARDRKWARGLFIAVIVMFIFSVILNSIGLNSNKNTLNKSPYNTYKLR